MKASIVDLRYKMNDVLKALSRNEEVTILYRGKPKGRILPLGKRATELKVKDHPFFGLRKDDKESVSDIMNQLRAPRYQ